MGADDQNVEAGITGAGAGQLPASLGAFDQIAEAHTDMEQNRASGKLVVTTGDGFR